MSNAPPIEEVVTRTDRFRRRRHAFDRWQRRFLVLGAMIDGVVGSLLFALPRRTTALFQLIVPPEGNGEIWVQLVGLLLLTMACVYLYAALDPTRVGIVVIGAAGRLWAVAFYLSYVICLAAPPMFLVFTVLDAIMFLLHVWALGPDRWSRVKSALEYHELS